jgi:hypothetical protein
LSWICSSTVSRCLRRRAIACLRLISFRSLFLSRL